MSDTEFSFGIRVYIEDTDAGGIVYHANYLRFMERARTEWLRRLGFEQDELSEREQVIFVVKKIDIDYRSPARFNDEIDLKSKFGLNGPYQQDNVIRLKA